MSGNDESVESLCEQLLVAKEAENDARKERIAIEEKIISIVGVKEEGSTTVKGANFKITTTGGLTRKVVDWGVFQDIDRNIAEQMVKTTHALNLTGYRAVAKLHPDIIAMVSKGIEAKPSKPSVKVEVLNA